MPEPIRDPQTQALLFPPDEREAEISRLRFEIDQLRQAGLLLVDFIIGVPGKTLPEIRALFERQTK